MSPRYSWLMAGSAAAGLSVASACSSAAGASYRGCRRSGWCSVTPPPPAVTAPGSPVVGMPAKLARQLSDEEAQHRRDWAGKHVRKAGQYLEALRGLA